MNKNEATTGAATVCVQSLRTRRTSRPAREMSPRRRTSRPGCPDPDGADRSDGVPISQKPPRRSASRRHDERATPGPVVGFVRYGIAGLTVLAGIVGLIFNFGGLGIEELFAFAGADLSIMLLNVLFRMGQDSDREHEDHETAWRFYESHGHWPGEPPPGRQAWNRQT